MEVPFSTGCWCREQAAASGWQARGGWVQRPAVAAAEAVWGPHQGAAWCSCGALGRLRQGMEARLVQHTGPQQAKQRQHCPRMRTLRW